MSYYSRQMLLPEVGVLGQQKLQNGKCLIVGAGGLGSPILLYLAAAGIGKLGICDGDLVEESNLHRQPIYSIQDIGKPKALTAAQKLAHLNPAIELVTYPFRLTEKTALPLFSEYDLILDCTDNFPTKFLINDAAYLAQKPLIRASIYQFEGQIQTYIPKRGDACLRCLWEELPQEGCVKSCQEVGVLGPVPAFFGIMQAMETIKFFLELPLLPSNHILFTDLLHYGQHTITCTKRTNCPLCGQNPSIRKLPTQESWEIEAKDLQEHLLIDIRELSEILQAPCPRPSTHLPSSSFDASYIDPSLRYALFCARGRRSHLLTQQLRAKGLMNVFSLLGGLPSLQNTSR